MNRVGRLETQKLNPSYLSANRYTVPLAQRAGVATRRNELLSTPYRPST